MIEEWVSGYDKLQPRLFRDVKRLCSLIKSLALLNWFAREKVDEQTILTSDIDVSEGIALFDAIYSCQKLGLPPYVYNFFIEIIFPLFREKETPLTRRQILRYHKEIRGREFQEHRLRKEVLPMLESAGLVEEVDDPNDKRVRLVNILWNPEYADENDVDESGSEIQNNNIDDGGGDTQN